MIHHDTQIILDEIARLRGLLAPKLIKELKLDLLERIVQKMDESQDFCIPCREYLSSLEAVLSRIVLPVGKYESKLYARKMKQITKHLEQKHKLVTKGFYMNTYTTLGLIFGVSIGIALGNIALGPGLGVCVGLIVGSIADANAKRKGLLI